MELYRKASGKLVFSDKPLKNAVKENKNDIGLFVEWCEQNDKDPKVLSNLFQYTSLTKEALN